MRKFLLSASFLLAVSSIYAQVIFRVETPAPLVGNKNFSFGEAGAWGSPDMNDPVNAVRGKLVFIDDNTAGDSLGCAAAVNGAAINGNIAVIYRGSCEFGMKTQNAESAGAIAAVIINNVPGNPIQMGAGAVGGNVSIPVAMITKEEGEALKAEILAGHVTVFFGNKRGTFAVDLGILPVYTSIMPSTARPTTISSNASEFEIPSGTFLFNFGNSSQTGVSLKAEVSKDGNSLLTQTSTPIELAVNDSILVAFPNFSQSNYPLGSYKLKYSALSTNTDQSLEDNNIESSILINNDVFSYVKMDLATNKPVSTSRSRPGTFDTDFAACIAFKDKNASHLKALGAYFAAYADAGVSIQDERFVVDLIEWNDVYADVNNAVFENLVVVDNSEHTFDTDAQGQSVFVPFNSGVVLKNDQKYLVCVTTDNAKMLIGYDASGDYDRNITMTQFPVSPIRSGATWFLGGFGTNLSAAIGLVTSDANSINNVTANTTAIPYPMPAQEFINIPLKSSLSGKVSIDVLDLTGRKLSTKTSELNKIGDLKVTTADLANGIYSFVLTFEDASKQAFKVQINK